MYRCFTIHETRDFACRIPNMQFRFSLKIGFFLTFITFRGFPSSLAPSFTQSRYPVTFPRNFTVFTTSILTVWSKPPKFTLCKKWIFSQNQIYTFCKKKTRISHFISIEFLNTNIFLYLINLNIVRKH